MSGDECACGGCAAVVREAGKVSNEYQRIFVTSASRENPEDPDNPLYPHFLVHAKARDEFIDQIIADQIGTREDGSKHEWVAFDEPQLTQGANQ